MSYAETHITANVDDDGNAQQTTPTNRLPVESSTEERDVMHEILTQLKILNMSIAMVTGNRITKNEVE